jgi:hypothetical protein
MVYAPLCAALILSLGWSYARTGHAFVTTQPLSAGLYSAMRLEQSGTPVFTGDGVLDRVARQTLTSYEYPEAMEINRRLLVEYNLSAPEQSALLQDKFFEIWRDHTHQMIALLLKDMQSWAYVFLVTDMSQLVSEHYDDYTRAVFFWAYFCAVLCPVFVLIVGVFSGPARCLVPAVLALLIFALLPTIAYAAFGIELRYLIFATGPLLLLFALFCRTVVFAFGRAGIGHTALAAGPQKGGSGLGVA